MSMRWITTLWHAGTVLRVWLTTLLLLSIALRSVLTYSFLFFVPLIVPQAGDSFGLRFVKPTLLKHLTVTSSKSLTSLEGHITVLVSDRIGEHWVIFSFLSHLNYNRSIWTAILTVSTDTSLMLDNMHTHDKISVCAHNDHGYYLSFGRAYRSKWAHWHSQDPIRQHFRKVTRDLWYGCGWDDSLEQYHT